MTANDRLTGIAASLRLSLLGSTALVGSALLAGQAQAQIIPVVANPGGATVAPPVIAGDGSVTLGIDLTNRSRIIDFVSYNVGVNDTVNYTSSTATTNLVAVNRVLSTGTGVNGSIINGTISAGNGISVWLVNQDGITFNGRATLAGGSLMLSTLDFTSALDGLGNVDAGFRTTFGTTGNTGAFRFSGTSTRPITIGSNLSIAGSIVAIGQNITNGGTLASTAGSVVLVAASDVTFSQGLGNPLSITVNAGTALGGAVNVNNNVSGRSVLVAGGLQGNLTAALLNVKDGTTLSASVAGGTVTLATATTTVGANTVSITNGATAAPSIAIGGSLLATQTGSDVIVNSAANVTRTVAGAGTITAARNATITAANDVTVGGSSYTATTGTLSVTAGRDATLGALKAGDDVTASTVRDATFGGAVDAGDRFAITVNRNAIITGNVDAGGNVGLQILGTTRIDGDIAADGTFDLTRTTRLDQAGDIVANGASTLIVGTGGIVATGRNESTTNDLSITTTGSATLGGLTAANTVSVDAGGFALLNGAIGAGDLIVSSGGDTTFIGDATVDNDTTLTVGGDTIIDGDIATGNDFLVDTTQNYTQSGDVVAGNNADLTINVGASVTGLLEGTAGYVHADVVDDASFAAITAGTDITLTAGPTLAVTGAVTAGTDYVLEADAVTLGDATITSVVRQRAGGLVSVRAHTGDITGVGNLELRSNYDDLLDLTGSDVTLRADLGAVNFGADTAIFAGVEGTGTSTPRSDVIVTSQPGVNLGDVTAYSLYTAGSSGVTGGHDALIAAGSIVTGDVTVDDGLEIYASGATSDITTGALTSNTGDIFVSAERNVSIGIALGAPASNAAGVIGLQAGGTVTTGALIAGDDIAAQAGGTINVASATAGDDIDFLSTGGNVLLGNGSAGSGAFSTSVDFTGAPGSFTGAVPIQVVVGEDSDLALSSTIRLRSPTGDVRSTGTLTTAHGDIILNAFNDVAVNNATATGLASRGSIAVRAGGDVVQNVLGTLTSTTEDVAIGAGGNATLGTLVAADDIDLAIAGTVSWRALRLTRTAQTARFVDVVSGTEGAPDGVTFTGVVDALAGANVIRIRAAGTPGTVPLLPAGLIAGTVNSGGFTAQADAGDIRLGDVTAAGDISVTATLGSVTGLPVPYTAATGGSISGADSVLLGFTGSASLGAISADSVRTISTIATDTLRITSVTASDIALRTVTTLDVGTITGGTVDLRTTGGTALPVALEIIAPATALAPGFGTANLTASLAGGLIEVDASNGIAQLGTLTAGAGTTAIALPTDQILVTARAMTVLGANALNGSLSLIASDGLLSLDTGKAKQHITLVKRNDDGTSLGSATTTDILKVGNTNGVGGSLEAGYGIDVSSETSLIVNSAIAQGNVITDRDLLVTAAGTMLFNEGVATTGAIGLYAGGAIQGRTALVAGTLDAAQDVAIDAGGTVEFLDITAGDDVDIVASAGNILLQNVTSTGLGFDGTSVRLTGPAGQVGALTVLSGEDIPLTGQTIRLRAANGDIGAVAPGTINTQGFGEIYANALRNVDLEFVDADHGSVGLLAGGSASATTIDASEDVAIWATGAVTVGPFTPGPITAGDDIDIVGGSITLSGAIVSTGLGNGLTSLSAVAPAGSLDAIERTVEDPQLADATIRLRSASFITATPGIIETRARGEVFVNAGTNVTLDRVIANDGSIGILAGGNVTTDALIASRDIGVRGAVGGTTTSLVSITSATAGDDIDVVAINGDLALTTGLSNAVAGTGGTSLDLTGTPGALNAVAITAVEDTQLLGSTIRLRAETGNVSSGLLLRTAGLGDVLVNARQNAKLNQVFAQNGSIGILAGGLVDVTDAGSVLDASVDIGVQGGTGVTVLTAIAGDDIDLYAVTGDVSLTDGTAKGALGTGGTSLLVTGTAGLAGAIGVSTPGLEDAQLASGSHIRLRAETGNVVSLGTLETQRTGNVLVNAKTNATLKKVFARAGSIGVLAGGLVDVTGTGSVLDASEDVVVQGGTGVTIVSAIAGDDIDVAALTGNLTLTDGLSKRTGTGGTSVTFATAGTPAAVAVGTGEDSQLGALSTIRLRAAAGDVISAGTLETQGLGHVLVNARDNASLKKVFARAGSIGVLAGKLVDVTGTGSVLDASVDVGVQGGTGVTIVSAIAGDDIDVAALTGDLTLTDGLSKGTGAGGTSVVFGAPGAAATPALVASEDVELQNASIRLRAAGRDVLSTGTLRTQGTGDVLLNAARDVSLATARADAGSIGILAGRDAGAATLIASRDIGIAAGNDAFVTVSATAGDDIDVVAGRDVGVLSGVSLGTAGTGGSALVLGTAGATGAVRANGTEDAQLLNSSTIRLRAVTGSVFGAATTPLTGTTLTTAAGDILVNAAANATILKADAVGSVGVLAGGQVTAATLIATRDIGVQGGTGVAITTAQAGDDIDVIAITGDLSLTDGTSTGAGTNAAAVIFPGVAGAAGAVGFGAEDAQLGDATIRLRAANGNIASTGTLTTQAAGEVLVNASGSVSLATVQANAGSVGVLAGGAITATTLFGSRDIGVTGGTTGTPSDVVITSATAGDDIDVAALAGNLSIATALSNGTGTNGTSVVFTAPPGTVAAVAIGAEDAQLTAQTIRLRSQVGDVVSSTVVSAQGTGDALLNAAGQVLVNDVNANFGSVGVLAGTSVTATALAAGGDVVVQAGTRIDAGGVLAGDDVDMVALGGNLTVGGAAGLGDVTAAGTAGSGGTRITFATPAGTVGAVVKSSGDANQLSGSTIRLRSATGNVLANGKVTAQGTGDILVNAKIDLELKSATTAKAGSVALLAGGNLKAATTIASEDVAARAGGDATLVATTAGDDIEIAAGGLVTVTTGTIGGTAGAPASGLDARQATLLTAQAGQEAGIALNAGDLRGPKSLPTGSALANTANTRNIVIEGTNAEIAGDLNAGTGRVILRNTGTKATVVGDPVITSATDSFAVTNTELGHLKASTVVIDSGARALELGKLTVQADTGKTDTRFLGTDAVEITGAITVAGTDQRTLQIGGLLGDLGDSTATETLAKTIVARIDRTSRPKIDAGSALVELRGDRILFGTTLMVGAYLPLGDEQIALEVSNPRSKLYSDVTAQNLGTFLTARQVTVGYKNFALFQNTQTSNNVGVLINSPVGGTPVQTALALRLISTGETGTNAFAMFGVVNNFTGTTAAILTNDAVQITSAGGGDFRIKRVASRLNGCIIGAADRGCLATDVPQPNFNFYDERKVALFDIDKDPTIAISPLIGRGNDGLIVNVADAPVGIDTIECRPEDPNCPAKEAK